MRNSETALGVDFQENSLIISMALEQDYGLIEKIYVPLAHTNEVINIMLHISRKLSPIKIKKNVIDYFNNLPHYCRNNWNFTFC